VWFKKTDQSHGRLDTLAYAGGNHDKSSLWVDHDHRWNGSYLDNPVFINFGYPSFKQAIPIPRREGEKLEHASNGDMS
jgi:hypothetical protein